MIRSDGYVDHPRYDRRRSRRRIVVSTFVALAATAGIGYWAYKALAGDDADDPQVAAATGQLDTFLTAWASGDAQRAGR